jgi:hypothetical protein
LGSSIKGEAVMRIRTSYITTAGAAAVAIAAAPTAFATDQPSCNGSGSGTVCTSPGNVPIKTSPPDVRHHPSGEMPDLTLQDFVRALGLAT